MKNFIILLLTVFILSCATAPQISDDGFISSRPNFQVQFNKPIIKKSVESRRVEGGDIKAYIFSVNNTEGILIQILTVFHSTRIDYIYGPEHVLTNWGRMVLDPVVIDGRQWIKFVDVFNNEALFTGYFRIMDQAFISVGRICNADAYAEEIGSFQKGTTLNYGQRKLWDKAFAHTDQLFSIGRVTPAEPESAYPDRSPAQQKGFNEAEAYYVRGNDYHDKGQYDKAISDYTKAIELNPRLADAYKNRANAYRATGRLYDACSDWKQACELGACIMYEVMKRAGLCK